MEVDLHVHTIYSDGTDNPGEIVARSKAMGLGAVAITDHDTIEGIEPAIAAGRRHNFEIIPGVELGSEYHGQEVHILGYLVNVQDREFLARLSSLRSERELRMENMVKKLHDFGFMIDMDRIKAISGEGSMGRPHLASAMVETGMVKTIAEAFDLYIGHGQPAYVPRSKLTPGEAVSMIRACGGVAVLAHPGLHSLQVPLKELIIAGIVGLEARHPGHNRELTSYYERLAKEKGLIATGGSDYHGSGRLAGSRLGLVTVSYKVIEDLKEKKLLDAL
ncbi:MAG: PHP domain-containing protein [Desulfotomaculaceae bacterium]|nr:PHP domain-containing protein [Desulfotomaculaceae bacterium]